MEVEGKITVGGGNLIHFVGNFCITKWLIDNEGEVVKIKLEKCQKKE